MTVTSFLTAAEIERYGRHLVMPEVGTEGQRRLKEGRVLVVGAGGLGSPAALYLAAAGVGRLGLIDFDRVEATNLQRQILYAAEDVGRSKTEAAGERLAGVNPHVEVELLDARFDAANALELVERHDLVVDGSDNFATRYLVNDACVLTGTPNVFGSVLRFEGQVSVFAAADGPCYRCLFPEPPPAGSVPTCAEAGVLGVLPGVIGSLQALEAIKLLLGRGTPLVGRFLVFDGLELRFREVVLPKAPDCPVCSESPTITEPVAYDDGCATEPERRGPREVAEPAAAGEREETMNAEPVPFDIAPAELRSWMDDGTPFRLIDVRTPREAEIASIEGATLMPLADFTERLDELDPAETIVVHCHHGPRSSQAVAFLRANGFPGARNLMGGIDAWSREIDRSIPLY